MSKKLLSASSLASAVLIVLAGIPAAALAGNTVTGQYAVVAGGNSNTASGNYSAVGGGDYDQATADYATVVGGTGNSAGGQYAAVGGGSYNNASGYNSIIAGGVGNTANNYYATVCGGGSNTASGNSAFIGAGGDNYADGDDSAIGGGQWNMADGNFAMVPGGSWNEAGGSYSFAGGLHAMVRNAGGAGNTNGDRGTFVWADSTGYSSSNTLGTLFSSTGSNQFLIRANGGFGLNDTPPNSNIAMTIASTSSNDNRAQIYLHQNNSNNGVLLIGGDATTGSNSSANDASFYIDQYNASSQVHRLTLDGSGNLKVTAQAYKPGGGSWAASSDGRLKKNVQPLDHALDRLLALRGVTFEYAQHDDGMHPAGTFTGFIAQEVQPTFPEWIGHDENGYLTVGPQGFEALTVEALRQIRHDDDTRIAKLESENATLREQLADQLKAQAASIAQLREQVALLAANATANMAATASTSN